MENNKLCSKCGSEEKKQGKLFGIGCLHSLDANTGLGGSEIIVEFCSKCGNVTNMKVKNPSAIK
jgi:ribosomal protein S27AE